MGNSIGMRGSPLYSWLRRRPYPEKIRVDGKTVVVVNLQAKSKWADAIESIAQSGGTRLDALNAQGEVIRSTTIEPEEDEPAEGEGIPVPKGSEQLVLIAQLLKEAGDQGAARHAAAYELAFDKMVGMVQILSDRMTGLESAWQGTLEARAEELRNAEPESEDPAGEAIGKLISIAAVRGERPGPATEVKQAVVKRAVQSATRGKVKPKAKGAKR